jgi:hypothetical protein
MEDRRGKVYGEIPAENGFEDRFGVGIDREDPKSEPGLRGRLFPDGGKRLNKLSSPLEDRE